MSLFRHKATKGHLTIKKIGLTLWKVSVNDLLLYAWIINLNRGHMNAWCRPPTYKIQYGCPAWPWHRSGIMPSVPQSPVEAAAWPPSSPPRQHKKRGGSRRGRAQMEKNSVTGQTSLRKRRAGTRRRRRHFVCWAADPMYTINRLLRRGRQSEKRKTAHILSAYGATKYCTMGNLPVVPQTLP